MLSPKRTKYRKYHRGRMRGKATRGNEISFGKYGLQTNDMHFNLKGHRCVANSIIKKLENDNWKPTNVDEAELIQDIKNRFNS